MPNLDDIGHWFGSDLQLSPTGDLLRVEVQDRSKQRVLRRLCTNPSEYIQHVNYGAGLPKDVGSILNIAATTGKIRGQMLLEVSVARDPPPAIDVSAITNGCTAVVGYIAAPERQPVALSFTVND